MQCLHQVAKLVMRAFAYKMRRTARDRAGWTEMTKQRALPGDIVLVSGHFSLSFPLVVRLFCRKLSRSTEEILLRPANFFSGVFHYVCVPVAPFSNNRKWLL